MADTNIGVRITTKGDTSGIDKTNKSLGLLKTALGAAAGVAGVVGLQSALSRVVGVMKDSILAAGNAAEVQNRFRAVFGATADEADRFSQELSKAVGRSTIEIQQGLASFQSFAVGMGLAGEQAFEMSKRMEQLAIDFASFNNISDSEAQQRFIAVLSGSAEALDQFGVNVKESAVELQLQEMGLAKSSASATELQKAVARLGIIEEVMGEQGAIGDAIKTSGSFNNQLKMLRSTVLDMQVAFGRAFTEAAGDSKEFGATIVEVVRFSMQALSALAIAIAKTAKGVIALGGSIAEFKSTVSGSASSVVQDVKQADGLLNKIKAVFVPTTEAVDSHATALGALRQGMLDVTEATPEDFFGRVNEKVGGVITTLDQLEVQIGAGSVAIDGIAAKMRSAGSAAAGSSAGYQKLGNALTDAAKASGNAAKQSADDAKKAADTLKSMTEKVRGFRQSELDMTTKVADAYRRQKEDLANLSSEYSKNTAKIREQAAELQKAFDRSEKSARESFISSLGSAVSTAEETIKAREEQIKEEESLGAEANRKKIEDLKQLNERDRKILNDHKTLVEEAKKAEEDSKTAIGIEKLISRFEEERALALENFQKEKADLQQQLEEKAQEYKKATDRINQETARAVDETRQQYVRLFDDLYNELKEHNLLKLLQTIGVNTALPSKVAQAAADKLVAAGKAVAGKRAAGGPITAGLPYLVGENGPEVVVPSKSGTVVPNHQLGSQNITVNVQRADSAQDWQRVGREIGFFARLNPRMKAAL